MIGIACDIQGKKIVEPFLKEQNITFPVALDIENRVLKQYGVRGVPTLFLIEQLVN